MERYKKADRLALYRTLDAAWKAARRVSTTPRVIAVRHNWYDRPLYAAVGDTLLYPDGRVECLVYGRNGYTTYAEIRQHYCIVE